MTITLEVAFCFFHNVGVEEIAETLDITSWFVLRAFCSYLFQIMSYMLFNTAFKYEDILYK